ncbi:hypothetical protein LVJ94_03385 [Pendulispora rubella]|uniref:Alpha/beta hydrolase n=1 Tax=Pendulispora rubella TaxID=2741070 RepID=A0ABZ2L5S6_9BACT
MSRGIFWIALSVCALWGCTEAPSPVESAEQSLAIGEVNAGEFTRNHITGDVYHYGFSVRVGDAPNAKLWLHRVVREAGPWRPRPSAHAVMLMHGDFATFTTNFAPALGVPPSPNTGLATYLAEHGIDVWGLDRRWARIPAEETRLQDLKDMGVAQELDDVGRALAVVRAVRAATGSGAGRIALGGFSRGGQLTYAYASLEAARPEWERHVKGIVSLDEYAEIAPEDEPLRKNACISRDYEQQALADGVFDSTNEFIIAVGTLAMTAPNDRSPYFPNRFVTNEQAFLDFSAKTYLLYQATPVYHLLAGVIENDHVTGLRETLEDTAKRWYAGAPLHQSMREAAEADGLWCNEGPLAVDAPLSRIRVPLLYLGAAGGIGDHGLYTTTRVSSTDVTTRVVRRLPVEREAEDFGHSDMLFGNDAASLVWQPLVAWLRSH